MYTQMYTYVAQTNLGVAMLRSQYQLNRLLLTLSRWRLYYWTILLMH